MSNISWAPARVLDIPEKLKDPRFVYRWASKLGIGRVQKLIAEGWEIDTELSTKLCNLLPKTIEDGSSLDSTTQRRELVVMRLPKELAKVRNEYYQKRCGDTIASAEDKLKKTGFSYGIISTNVTKGMKKTDKEEEIVNG